MAFEKKTISELYRNLPPNAKHQQTKMKQGLKYDIKELGQFST